MEQLGDLTDGQLLAVIGTALDVLTAARPELNADRDELAVMAAGVRVAARVQAWLQSRAARLDAREVALRAHGTTAATWLMTELNYTHREAAKLVRSGELLERFSGIAKAAAAGEVLPPQAEAITAVLADLPDDLPATAVTEGAALMVEFAKTHNSAELRRLSSHLLECVAPEVVEAEEADRLEREHRQATRNRHLSFVHDHRGSVLIRGSLPSIEAEPFIAIIDAYVGAQRGLDRADPTAQLVTPGMRRADALLAMVQQHSQWELAPNRAGDRPRVVVTLNYHAMRRAANESGALHGRLASTGEPVSAGVLRRLLCDAEILPIVLGDRSEVLDVGRSRRLVTPAIRVALEYRDQGCVFPGCDKPSTACHAHHLVPWWAGGATALTNLVLLCPHHHGIVEPGHDPRADRWTVQLQNNVARVTPPARVDPSRRPRVHARFQNTIRRT